MKRHYRLISLFVVILFAAALPGCARGAEFRDYGPLYAVYIPDNWIYQAKESTPLLNVFYGAGEYDLLYFELLENVCDRSAGDFGRRALQLYAAAGGLRQFELLEPLSPVEVGGLDGVKCTYIYKDAAGTFLREERVFFILPGRRGFSLALAGPKAAVDSRLLQDIIRGWRWFLED
ncbi:MAG TPA: hypothetical protein GX521_04190 [Firmicutes bacterium]|nr:hypothetical protein [Bacillota bacterium]